MRNSCIVANSNTLTIVNYNEVGSEVKGGIRSGRDRNVLLRHLEVDACTMIYLFVRFFFASSSTVAIGWSKKFCRRVFIKALSPTSFAYE